jgi:undecaprenyl-phosphate galactose phosphotransferase/putative colanic acid biosynthesis UDP-glucose lipid carrier transferase
VLDFTASDSGLDTRNRPRITISYHSIAPFFAAADAIIILLASVAGAGGYQFLISGSLGQIEPIAGLGFIGSLAYCLSARHLGLYDIQNLLQQYQSLVRIVSSLLFVVFVVTVTLFLFKIGQEVSRGSVMSFFGIVTFILLGWRRVATRHISRLVQNKAITGRRAVLIGSNVELASLSPDKLLVQFGIDEARRVILPFQQSSDLVSALQLAALDTAVDAARAVNADEVLICVSWDSPTQLQLIRERLRILPLPVRLLPDRFVRSIWDSQRATGNRPLLMELQRAPLSASEQAIKRFLDLTVASLAIITLFPLMLLTALVVKFETGGTVIFRQRRKGFNDREFKIWKFRTMSVNEDGKVIPQVADGDKRVTTLGRVLRRASIDELPQLFNVLKGEMSLIGPRPHAVAHDDEYGNIISQYAFRHHVKPGMTGWAQVNGFRGNTSRLEDMQKRVELDLWYINNWSVALDLQILARTCVEVMRGRNAY